MEFLNTQTTSDPLIRSVLLSLSYTFQWYIKEPSCGGITAREEKIIHGLSESLSKIRSRIGQGGELDRNVNYPSPSFLFYALLGSFSFPLSRLILQWSHLWEVNDTVHIQHLAASLAQSTWQMLAVTLGMAASPTVPRRLESQPEYLICDITSEQAILPRLNYLIITK